MRAEALAPPALVAAASEADLFRYSEQSWLAALSASGAAVGLGAEAGRIFRTSSGRYYVPVAAEREAILRLKSEPGTASVVTYVVALANARAMTERLGRPVTAGDLTLAHLLGREAAIRLAHRAAEAPQLAASSELPAEALANPALFFSGTRARTVGEVAALGRQMALAPRGSDTAITSVQRSREAARLAKAALKGTMGTDKGGAGEGAIAEARGGKGR